MSFLGSDLSKSDLEVGEKIVDSRKTTIFSKGGKKRGSVVLLTEITERKRVEDALRQSEERLALAVKGGNVGLWDFRIKEGELSINDRYYQIMGYSTGEPVIAFQSSGRACSS